MAIVTNFLWDSQQFDPWLKPQKKNEKKNKTEIPTRFSKPVAHAHACRHATSSPTTSPDPVAVLPLWRCVLTPRCWRVSRSACRPTSASTSTRACCRAARPSAAPPRAASAPWPWGSRPPMRPPVTRWCTAETCSLRSTSSRVAPSRSSRRTWWWPSWVSPLVAKTKEVAREKKMSVRILNYRGHLQEEQVQLP